eukprot:3276722-Amphidinium_carterae.1
MSLRTQGGQGGTITLSRTSVSPRRQNQKAKKAGPKHADIIGNLALDTIPPKTLVGRDLGHLLLLAIHEHPSNL